LFRIPLKVAFISHSGERFHLLTIKGTQRRYKKAMIDYCNGAVEHVEDAFNGRIPPLEEYLAIHRRAAGVTPIIALVEYVDSQSQCDSKD
jgi:hypothetical protein